jgi:formylglycine-generating enzyme required for sulfatase activity
MKAYALFAALLSMCLVATAHAEFYNGRKLARDLDAWSTPAGQANAKTMYQSGVGIGYLYGICDALQAEDKTPLPAGVLGDQLAVAVRDYLREHPDQLDLPAARLVRDAIKNKYGAVQEQRVSPKQTGVEGGKDSHARRSDLAVPTEPQPSKLVENSVGMKMVLIPKGTFIMGEEHPKPSLNHTPHTVTLTKPFYIGVYEVTNAQWKRVTGSLPRDEEGANDSNPVTGATWDAARTFCQRLSALPEEREAGRVYRLPTEAEWEYACRAGTTTRHFFGDDDSRIEEYAWVDSNASGKNRPVGTRKPNPWGLFDMYGNVSEWCSDWYSELGSEAATDPQGPPEGTHRVHRGGFAGTEAQRGIVRSAHRFRLPPDGTAGVRVVMSQSDAEVSAGKGRVVGRNAGE